MSGPGPAAGVTLELTGRLAAGGDVIGRLADGRVVFVEGALPGETVVAALTADRRDFAKARVVSVVEASVDRVDAPCPHRHRGCGGCPWQEIRPAAQPGWKREVVVDALRRLGGVADPDVVAGPAGPATGYRTTVNLAVGPGGVPSYRRRHGHDLVAVDSCLVAHPALEDLLAGTRLPGHARVRLRVGTAGGERLVVLDRRPGSSAQVPDGAVVVGPGGRAHVVEEVAGRRWRVSARSFFQAGPVAATAIVDAVDTAVGTALPADGVLVDAYAGVGLIGGVLAARRRARLVAVESDPVATADARANLADLPAEVVTAEVGRWAPVPADVVVADPARSGLGRPGVATLAAAGAARLVLVSCDPASLGRDTALLRAAGYRLASAVVVDAFPHTTHVEVIGAFDRADGGL